MELGVYTFGDLFPDAQGRSPSAKEKLQNAIRLATLADEVGLDVFALGEHHRVDMAISSPAVVLAAIAQATKRIKLSSATTVLSTLDPVRVYEDFATVDLISGGRAEILAGRGSFTDNYPLFGYDLKDYDALFAEKLDLLLQLNKQDRVTWQGRYRSALEDAEISPRAERPIPIWLGVGGTPQSAIRAGRMGLPMNLAILGGPERFEQFVDLYRRAAAAAGNSARVAISSHGHLADDAQEARDEYYVLYAAMWGRGLKNRAPPRHVSREAFDREVGPRGGIFCGNAREIIEKIRWERKLFGMDRLLLQLDMAGLPYAKVARSIEILGTEVAPVIRKEFP